MKSAYELAMERLDKASGPTRKLTDGQKTKIADIEKIYEAKIAETRMSHETQLRGAASMEEWNALQAKLAEKVADFEARREREKDAVWAAE